MHCSNYLMSLWWSPYTISAAWNAKKWLVGFLWAWTAVVTRNLPTGMTCVKIVENKCVAGMCFWKLNAHLCCFFLKNFLNPNQQVCGPSGCSSCLLCVDVERFLRPLCHEGVLPPFWAEPPLVCFLNTTNWYLLLYQHSVFHTTACSSNLFLATGAAFLLKENNPYDAIKFPFCLLCTC